MAEETNVIRIKKWSRFQHYKDRSPPWIKLHRQLLHNRQWNDCSHGASKLLVECWLLASESDDGSIELSTADLAWRLRRELGDVRAWLQELAARDFIELVNHDASAVLAERLQDACPEGEGEGETEEVNDTDSPLTDVRSESGGEPRNLKPFHDEAAPLIREHWWRGDDPPRTARDKGGDWHMGRDLNVLDGFIKRGEATPDRILALIPLARSTLHLSGPFTAKVFQAAGHRERLNACLDAVRAEERKAAGDPVRRAGEAADRIVGAVSHG